VKSAAVLDPFGASADEALPTLREALDPASAEACFGKLPRLAGAEVAAIRVTRHKTGRRCLVEYDVMLPGSGAMTLIGKVRSRHSGGTAYRLQRAFWDHGFDASSGDGLSVPEPIGIVRPFRMWLQRKVGGRPASDLLESGGTRLASRIADLAHKVHRAGIPPEGRHGVAEELAILERCLHDVARERPALAARVGGLFAGCSRLGGSLEGRPTAGIHRDFYGDQVLMDGDRLWLLDLDLYCEGDPALDLGNFAGHVIEQALRTRGDAGASDAFVEALGARSASPQDAGARAAVSTWTTLTLARHVYLSTRFADRVPHVEAILALCETRLRETAS